MADGDIFRGDDVGVGTAAQAVVEITTTSGRKAYGIASLTAGGGVGGATAANQTTQITAIGGVTEAAPASDTASSGLNGRLQRIAQRITSLIALLPAALGAGGGLKVDGSGTALPISVTDGGSVALGAKADASYADTTGAAAGSLTATNKGLYVLTASLNGALTETAPATDTASSGLNGRMQRVAQRLTSLIALLPASLGIKTAAASLSIAPASDAVFAVTAAQATASNLNAQVVGAGASAAARVGNPVAIAFTYNSGVVTPTNGQALDAQCDANGALKVTPWTGNATVGDAVNNTGPIFSTAAGTIAAVRTYASLFNGTSWDRQRGDTNGLINQPYAIASGRWNYATPTGGIVNTTTAVTIISAAGVGVRNYMTALQVAFDALVTATEFAVRDGAAGTVLFRDKLPAGAAGSRTYNFAVPLKGTANTLMEVVTLTAAGAAVGVYPNGQGFQGS